MARDDWPVSEMQCDYAGCESTDTMPCFYMEYGFDVSVWEALRRYGLRQTWRLCWKGSIEVLEGYYCAEHAYKKGFCWVCGNFYAGASERFDFRIGGQWLCDGCWSNFEPEFEEEEDYCPGPWDN